ncbi:hypothetical protein MmiEs2_13670 [Methanimicrococcus stummii]|uniref:Right handed beta helix domain-containing protein n=1 Tax=Methanimicrococcus stummii TaxID=3028294 RepID=A0AA96ZXL3_9EURY|nr:right-handed parallel beta-helix repeat-containing protein [Methanimicrococcus sp. Es2]WNY29150.1 hypothetical protein MmiEs2_13670 [Methanimicrococcus sp. Es2]
MDEKIKSVVILFLLLTGLAFATSPAAAATIEVNDETALKSAFLSAVSGDEIVLKNDITITTGGSINLKAYWSTAENVITVKSDSDAERTITGNADFKINLTNSNNNTKLVFENVVIDGNGKKGGIEIAGSHPLLNRPRNIKIDGAQIKNFNSSGFRIDFADNIFLINVTAENCTKTGTSVFDQGNGAGISISNSSAKIENSLIKDNIIKGYGNGSGVYAREATVEINGNTFIQNNTIISDGPNAGAGIYSIMGTLNISGNTTVLKNEMIRNSNEITLGGGV